MVVLSVMQMAGATLLSLGMLIAAAAPPTGATTAPSLPSAPPAPPLGSRPAPAPKPPEFQRTRVPSILLHPLPASGGVPRMVAAQLPQYPPQRVASARAQVQALKLKHFGTHTGTVRQAGLAELRSFTDPASFEPLWTTLQTERDDVRMATLEVFASGKDDGQAALAWVAIRAKDAGIRAEATRRVTLPPCDAVLCVLDDALRSNEHEVVNNAGLFAGAIHAIEALPALIFAQFSQDTAQQSGDLAWIAIGTQRSYVQNIVPVTGDNSGAYQPIIGQILEGVVMRVADCVVTTYRADVHNSLIAMSTFDSGMDTASLDWNMQAWARWFNEEYVPLKQREDQQLAAASTTRPAGTTPPKPPSGTP
ncbi:MAG: hypothetical protein U0636_02965 [Phycisphaerales bacterium]